MIIAIDGPAGAGKSTIARSVAARLDLLYLDTGAMYRAVAWQALQSGVALDDEENATRVASEARIRFEANGERTFINGVEVTQAIREPQVDEASSSIAVISGVRRALVRQQQQIGTEGGLVAEGRDMTTVVFPNADVKIFLAASAETRACRRWLEQRARGFSVELSDVLAEVQQRDKQDSTRADSPLRIADDATVVDTTESTIEEVIERILEITTTKAGK